MDGLKRLDGASAVYLDEYVPGKGLFSVTYPAAPSAKPSDVKKLLVEPYVLDQVRATITVVVAEADGVRKAGAYRLSNGDVDPATLELGKRYVVRGNLSEDEKGVVTMALDRADAAAQ